MTKTRTLNRKAYTVSDLFATNKDFKNHIEPSNEFRDKAKELGIKQAKYILGQDIIDDVAKNGNKRDIINQIVKEQYSGSWFEFIKASGLVKLDGDKIDRSELTSCRDSYGNWRSDELGDYGYIWLRALYSNGRPICIEFEEGSAHWYGDYPEVALCFVELESDKQNNVRKTIYDYSDKQYLGDSGTIVAVDIYDRYIIQFDNLPDEVFAFEELQKDNIDIRFEKEIITERVDRFLEDMRSKINKADQDDITIVKEILLKHLPKNN